jgi:hypothetical protein
VPWQDLEANSCTCSNFTTSGKHAAEVSGSRQNFFESPRGQRPLHWRIQNPSAISDNSKSPQDAAIRYEPAAATKQIKTNLK